MESLTFTVGRMLCGQVRNFLDKCKFLRRDIDYIESSGWFERDFVVKGSAEDIIYIEKSINAWIKENNLNSRSKS